jgi:NAD(P)-dependent dehydrogenase (short-subunit alcohol dehydrogenase family)
MKVVVSGSSSGIGHALVSRLLAEGHTVWGIARSDQASFANELGDNFRHSKCDVGSWDETEATARQVKTDWTSIDGLVCCAGSQGEVGPAVRANPARWSATVQANLVGTFNTIRAFHGLLLGARRRAKIVCFSGGGATKSRPNFSAYGVAKAAIVRLVETIAEEERDAPLDINAVAPGAIATRLTNEVIALGPDIAGAAEFDAALKQRSSGGASLERALDLVEWLLSEKSDGISGRLLSAPWDPWQNLAKHVEELAKSDVYLLRRIVPEDRGLEI